jgi:amino acid transporter
LTPVADAPATGLRRVLGVRDLVLFYFVATFSLRWVAVAAAGGPASIGIWILAAACFFLPLVFTVLELSSRYPGEGGLYLWSKAAFGPFSAFLTGWTYWAGNLPYFPGLLYFAAANALFIGGSTTQALSASSSYFALASLLGLVVAAALNVVGLGVGKWLTNIGGGVIWIPLALLFAFAGYSWFHQGPATPLSFGAVVPGTSLKDVVMLSSIAFAFAGMEAASTMGDEIADPRRSVPRAIVLATILVASVYTLATLAVILALPTEQVSGLQGVMQAIQVMAGRAGVPWLVPLLALCVTLNVMGSVGSWFAATARLPFVAGLDAFLPAAFGRIHPRWRTPHVAIIMQAAAAAAFVVLGQAGTTVRGAYDAFVSMTIIVNLVPFLYIFASMYRLQREPAGPDVSACLAGRSWHARWRSSGSR